MQKYITKYQKSFVYYILFLKHVEHKYIHQQHCFKMYDKNLWNIKKNKYILKRCVPLTVYTMSKVHEKFVFQKIRMKPRHIVIKNYTLQTISKCLNLIIQFS